MLGNELGGLADQGRNADDGFPGWGFGLGGTSIQKVLDDALEGALGLSDLLQRLALLRELQNRRFSAVIEPLSRHDCFINKGEMGTSGVSAVSTRHEAMPVCIRTTWAYSEHDKSRSKHGLFTTRVLRSKGASGY